MRGTALFSFVMMGWLASPAVVPAVAQDTVYNTSAASILCTTMIGTVSPKPALTMLAQPTVLQLKATVSGCTVTGAVPADPPLQVISGKMTAKLPVTTDASCGTLIGGFQVADSLVFRWKTAKGQELDFPESAFAPDSAGLVAGLLPVGVSTYGVFTSTGTVASGGAFGAGTPSLLLLSAEDIYTMFGQCCTDPMSCSPVGEGIRRLHFSIGQVQM